MEHIAASMRNKTGRHMHMNAKTFGAHRCSECDVAGWSWTGAGGLSRSFSSESGWRCKGVGGIKFVLNCCFIP